MRKIISIAIYIVLCAVSVTVAGGVFATPGTRAKSMGGAYVGIADDLTAIYWNPAGLVQISKSYIEASVFYANSKSKSNHSLGNGVGTNVDAGDFPVPIKHPNEPDEYQNKTLELFSVIPFMAVNSKIKSYSVAAGIYGIGGGGGKWKDSLEVGVDDLDASMNALMGFVVANISVAKEIYPKLSLGMGINLIYMMDNSELKKKYQKNAGSLQPVSYSISAQHESAGTGLEVIGGSLYRPVDNLRIGFVFRSGAEIKLNGTAKLKSEGLLSLAHETDYEKKYAYPLTYGFGAAFEPVNFMTVSAGITMNNYSVIKNDIDYEAEVAGFLVDADEKEDWKNTAQIHFGTEYRYNENLSFRGGLLTEPVPTDSDNISLLNTNQYEGVLLNLGVGYNMELFELGFSYTHSFSDEPEKDSVKYKNPIDSFRIGMSRRI